MDFTPLVLPHGFSIFSGNSQPSLSISCIRSASPWKPVIGKIIAATSVQGLEHYAVQPHGAVATARVSCISRTVRRCRRRTRRRMLCGGGGDSGGEDNFWYYLNPGGCDPTDGGGFGFNGGEGGGGWNSDWFSGHSWEDASRPPRRSLVFAVKFFQEVIYWVALSNCLHFAFKKAVRTVA